MNILEEIISKKIETIERRKKILPLELIKEKLKIEKIELRSFKKAISKENTIAIIAEMKRSSPSAGQIKNNYDIVKISKEFQAGGADAISVLTEEFYFQGDLLHIPTVKTETELPILRKDFIIDEYQIYESRYFGADAILLITSILKDKIKKFYEITKKLQMDALVEIHTEEDLEIIKNLPIEIIGINNRNLNTLQLDLTTTFRLKKKIKNGRIIVSESGIKDISYIRQLKQIGVNAVLIGEVLMKSNNIQDTLKAFKNGCL